MAVTIPGRIASTYNFPRWDRFDEILSSSGETILVSQKDFRDGLAAVIVDSADHVCLNASRVDDNGVLRIRGGCHQDDFSFDIMTAFFEFVHSLWDQTHTKAWGSEAAEGQVYPLSTHDQQERTALWGFVEKTWDGGADDDFFFEYQYTIDVDTDYITLLNFPSDIEKSTTTHTLQHVRFYNKGGTFPTGIQNGYAFEEDKTYYTTLNQATPEQFQIRRIIDGGSFDFTDAGSVDGRWIGTPFGREVYVKRWLGNVTYTTCSFILHIHGDYDQDTLAEVRYRRKGTTEWKRAADARAARAADTYELYKYHVSSAIFRLNPNTEYEIQLTLSNPHGVYLGGTLEGTSDVVIETTFRTRPRVRFPQNGTTHYPQTLDEIKGKLGLGGTGSPAEAGDTIVIPVGNFSDYNGTNTMSGIGIQGTELNPIHIIGEDSAANDNFGCVLPKLFLSNGGSSGSAEWLCFEAVRFNNYGTTFNNTISQTIKATGHNKGLSFINCSLESPDDIPKPSSRLDPQTDPATHCWEALDNGDWFDVHGGYFLGGSANQDHKWTTVEDNKLHLGYLPMLDASGDIGLKPSEATYTGGWIAHEAFDARVTSMVWGFNECWNSYDCSFSHSSGTEGKNEVFHNEVHHNQYYGLYDDWIECDHSDGGHMIYNNVTWHGVSWGHTNFLGNVSQPTEWKFRGQLRTAAEWTLTDVGVVDGHQSWDFVSTVNFFSDGDVGDQLRQRRMYPYTVNTSTDTFTFNNHPYTNNQTVTFQERNGAGVPGGLTAETFNWGQNDKPPTSNNKYYIVNATANTFQVSLTQGGEVVDITSDPGADGRWVADSETWWIWQTQRSYGGANERTKLTVSTIAYDRYPDRDEYVSQAPYDNTNIIINQGSRSSFTGYRVLSAQGGTGSIPIWEFANQHTGLPLVGAPDAPFKWKDAGASLNIIGNVLHSQYTNERMHTIHNNGSEFFCNNVWLKESSGYFSTQTDSIGNGPTSGTVSNPIQHDWLVADRNAYWNQDNPGKGYLGQSSVTNHFLAYGMDEYGARITTPSDDLDNMWDVSESAVKSPIIGFYADSDVGTSAALTASDTGLLYDAGVNETDMPGVDNVLGPYLNNADTANLSFMATKTNDRRDIGANQRGLGKIVNGRRSYVDFLTYMLPDGWEVKTPGTDYASLAVTTGTGVERLLIGRTDNTAAILVEYEEIL